MSLEFLDIENNTGYIALGIPCARDEQISEALRAWAALEEPERSAAMKRFWHGTFFRTLEVYSLRMANLAVRTANAEFIFLGLLALGVHGHLEPWGIHVVTVALHYDASVRIGANSQEIFEKAAALLPDRAAKGIRGYLTRPDDQKTIEVMSYHTTTDEDGFRYEKDKDPLAQMRKRRSQDNDRGNPAQN